MPCLYRLNGILESTYLRGAMRRNVALASVACLLLLSACELLGDSADLPEPLRFDEVQYTKYGGWINTFKLTVRSSGEATAELVGHGSGEVIKRGAATVTSEEREHLASLLAPFPRYRQSYQPDTYYTDGNTHVIVVHYEGTVDTVWTYNPHRADLPRSLWMTIQELERIYERAIPEQP